MKIKPILFGLIIALTSAAVCAQAVIITPKKTTYRRPKPLQDSKSTFTVRRPVAKAATPALSRKITAAISPERVLKLNIREEMSEYQWLEEADYKVLFNQDGVLCVELWMSGTAAYPDGVTGRVVVDPATGAPVRPANVFQNLPVLAKIVKKAQAAEIATATKGMKSDPEARPSDLFSDSNFTVADFKQFSVDARGVTFYYDYGFPHVIQALEPAGEFNFTWAQLKPFVRSGGLLARFIR
ncbi:MAG: hypothetical protein ABJB34_04200 [Acidobacteriota bacterium]